MSTFFISYNHEDIIVADLMLYALCEKGHDVKLDKRDVDAWQSFKDFMMKLRKQDYVITIISDAYLKSINCMYEISELMKDDYKQKVFTVVLIKDIHKHEVSSSYIKYWESKLQELKDEANSHFYSSAKRDSEIEIEKVSNILDDLPDFLRYVAEIKNPNENIMESICNRISSSFSSRVECIKLSKIIKRLNKNILSIQLIDCSCQQSVNDYVMRFRKIDSLVTKDDCDIDSIESLYLSLPITDYAQFFSTIITYDKIVEEDLDISLGELKLSVNKAEAALLKRLQTLTRESITKQDCCLARLLICYKNFLKMIDSPEVATIDIYDGILGVLPNVESALFSAVRSGIMGAVLFGDRRRYYYRYKSGLSKTGLIHCASIIKSEAGQKMYEQNCLLCLITIKEVKDVKIPPDVIDWIRRKEDDIRKEYRKYAEVKKDE